MTKAKADSEIVFTVRLTRDDWDPSMRAWRCPALAIPKAEIADLFVDGRRTDKADYEVIKGPPAVRWIAANPPDLVAVQIRLGEELSLEAETDRWKKLTVVLPVLASIVAALISGTATHLSTHPGDGSRTADLVKAHFNDWNLYRAQKSLSYRLTADPIDLTEYIKQSDKQNFSLVVALRPRSGTSDLDGQYEYALRYPFDNTLALTPRLPDRLRETIATGCLSLILFRVSAAGLQRIPFNTPFVPAHYGSDIKLLESEYDGSC
jgi:hypothetical protein